MAFQPAATLYNRTFIGLIVAQFLAGFNDQAIHAMAMFYARHTGILSEAQAISLMPILFYAPWAIFCTISGYLADRFSKTYTLVVWKVAEIVISLVLILGLALGTNAGAWIVLTTVFMMGTHAAFFAPAKYGAMPEILQPHLLSRGNGILESTTFLASILGTVGGGFLFFQFQDQEVWVGVIILAISVVGAAASFMIAYLPSANPARPFPFNPLKALVSNLKLLFGSRPLALSVIGIAFFVFMVAYMRSSVYMHGESRHWPEWRTSLIVATVALGVFAGSPLAGYLSGGKIELGMIPLACVGMALANFTAGLAIEETAVLVVALSIIGFFSGFYMVPLYTLLQHRAPKTSKGDLVATSNFINVIGAMAASILFFLLVEGTHLAGIALPIQPVDRLAAGTLEELTKDHGHVTEVRIRLPDGEHVVKINAKPRFNPDTWIDEIWDEAPDVRRIAMDDELLEVLTGGLKPGDPVVVSKYTLRDVDHYLVRAEGQPLKTVYDDEILPRYLFIGAGLMTLGILTLLTRLLPDFFLRTLFWLRSLGRYKIRELGMKHLPTHGPVVLATNCNSLESGLQLVSVTDRTTRVLLPGGYDRGRGFGMLRSLAARTTVIEMPASSAGPESWDQVRRQAADTLAGGHLLAITVDGAGIDGELESFLAQVRRESAAPVVPVFCGPVDPADATPRMRVCFGQPAKPGAALADLRTEIHRLGDAVRSHDDSLAADEH